MLLLLRGSAAGGGTTRYWPLLALTTEEPAAPGSFQAAWAAHCNARVKAMLKNTAGQKVGAQMVSATDGSAFTSAVTCYVTVDAGTQATGSVGSGACTHEGNGFHTYAPAQAETNGDHLAFTFAGSGAVPATLQSYTIEGDAYTRLGAPAGASVSADVAAIKAETASILTDTAEIGAAGAGLTTLATAAALATVDTNVDAILADTGTDGVVVSATGVRAAVGLASANLDTQLDAVPTAAENADAVWDEAQAGHVSAGTFGEVATETAAILVDTAEIGTAGAGLTALATAANLATVSSNVDAILTDTGTTLQAELDGIQADTEDIQARLPAALVSGRMSADAVAISGSTTAADRIELHASGVLSVVIGSGSTTTSVVLNATTGINGGAPSSTNDFYNGRVLVFITGTLAGQATSISDYAGSTVTATVVALTGSPQAGDTAVLV